MTDDLLKKLNTTGAFDTLWLKEQLENWDAVAELKKADFIEYIYQCYQPGNHCYTGLWERFCMTEAGPFARDKWFEMKEAVRLYEAGQLQAETLA
tara:strand:- start:388 stop:672 length:285 start_codon:yes stop_codon:yes gene_type:complete